MPPAAEPESIDRCFRCDYDLRGIADAQPCPECGLLAERSRRKTEQLVDAPPAWLRTIAIGLLMILAGAVGMFVWLIIDSEGLRGLYMGWWNIGHGHLLGYDAAAILLLLGVLLFTRAESLGTVDRAERIRRRCLLIAAAMPLLAMAVAHGAEAARGVAQYRWPYWLSERYAQAHISPTRAEFCWYFLSAVIVVVAFIVTRRRTDAGHARTGWIARWLIRILATLPCLLAAAVLFHSYALTSRLLPHVWSYGRPLRIEDGLNYYGYLAIALFYAYSSYLMLIIIVFGAAPLPALVFYRLRYLARRALRAELAEHCAILSFGTVAILIGLPLLMFLLELGGQWFGPRWQRNSLWSAFMIMTWIALALTFGAWSVLTLLRGAVAFAAAARARRRLWKQSDFSTRP